MSRNEVPVSATVTALILNLLAAGVLALTAFLLAALGVWLQRGMLVAEDRDTLLLLQILHSRVPLLFVAVALLVLAAAWAFLRAHAVWLGRRSGFRSAQRKAAAVSVVGAVLAAHHALAATGSAEGLVFGLLLGVLGLLSFGVMFGAGEPDSPPARLAVAAHHGLSVASMRPGWRTPPTRLGDAGRPRRSLR
jgi:hypothetical protein